jgi:hypothetical protein
LLVPFGYQGGWTEETVRKECCTWQKLNASFEVYRPCLAVKGLNKPHNLFFVEWEMLQIKVVEKIKTHFMLHNFFFSKIVPFMR